MATESTPPLLNLPIELFFDVWERLPLYSRASLVLSCRQLYASYLAFTFGDVFLSLCGPTPAACLQRLYFLRLLRRDRNDRSLFLCQACLKLHHGLPTEGEICDVRRGMLHRPGYAGFPYCNSAFTLALKDVQSRLEDSADRGPTFYSGSYRSSLPMEYKVRVDVSCLGLCMATEYIYHDPNAFPNNGIHGITSPTIYASLVRRTNLDFCQHLWLGYDFAPGDGTMNDRLEAAYTELSQRRIDDKGRVSSMYPQEWPEFRCTECHINVRIEAWSLSRIRIYSWQYFNPKKPDPTARPARIDRVDRPLYYPLDWPPEEPQLKGLQKANRDFRIWMKRLSCRPTK